MLDGSQDYLWDFPYLDLLRSCSRPMMTASITTAMTATGVTTAATILMLSGVVEEVGNAIATTQNTT